MSKRHRQRKTSPGIFALATLLLLTSMVAGIAAFTHSHGTSAVAPSPLAEAAFLPTVRDAKASNLQSGAAAGENDPASIHQPEDDGRKRN